MPLNIINIFKKCINKIKIKPQKKELLISYKKFKKRVN